MAASMVKRLSVSFSNVSAAFINFQRNSLTSIRKSVSLLLLNVIARQNGKTTGYISLYNTIPSCQQLPLCPHPILRRRLRALGRQQRCQHQMGQRSQSGFSGGPNPGDPDRSIEKRRLRESLLMDFPQVVYPSYATSPVMFIRNKFLGLLIRGYFDDTFSQKGFLEGGKLAITAVSSLISQGNFDGLEGLVHSSVVPEIRHNYEQLDSNERRWLQVNPDDFYAQFIHQIGIIMPDDESGKRFVEIMAVYHGCHGLAESEQPMFMFANQKQGSNYCCNYRFIREMTKGADDSWLINRVNHFLLW